MYILRRPGGAEVSRVENEEDVWSPLWPSIPWPGMDVERVMKWVKETHLGLGWTVEETEANYMETNPNGFLISDCTFDGPPPEPFGSWREFWDHSITERKISGLILKAEHPSHSFLERFNDREA